MSLFAGIDCGTQSTKVVVYDTETKSIVAQGSHAYPLVSRDDGSREQEAAWFTDAVVDCFNQIDLPVRRKVKGIGVSGQQHGFVPLDKDGNVIAPVKLWCDTSTVAECDRLTEKVGGAEQAIALVGNQFKTGFTVGKVYAMKLRHPDLWARLAHILLPHDWLNYWLTGRYVMERGDASGTAMFDIVRLCWSRPVLEAIDPSADWDCLLPELVSDNEVIGTVRPDLARELGLSSSVIVSAGGGDNMMAAIGTGCVEKGAMTVSMGTSGTVFAYSDAPIADETGALSGFCSSNNGYLPLMCTMNCTIATEQIRSLFGMTIAELNSLAGSEAIGSQGVSILPYFNGERTPDFPCGKAVFAGFDTTNCSKATLARAAMESAVFSLMDGVDAFRAKAMVPSRILLTGGGAKSPLWRQMVSDVFGVPVSISTIGESAALGGALQALWASGEEGVDLAAICKRHVALDSASGCVPDPDAAKAYQAALQRFRSYQTALAPLFRYKGKP